MIIQYYYINILCYNDEVRWSSRQMEVKATVQNVNVSNKHEYVVYHQLSSRRYFFSSRTIIAIAQTRRDNRAVKKVSTFFDAVLLLPISHFHFCCIRLISFISNDEALSLIVELAYFSPKGQYRPEQQPGILRPCRR